MGLTYILGNISGPNGVIESLKFLVDSGAGYSLIPYEHWQVLGIKPCDRFECTLVDGSVVYRDVGECEFEILGKRGWNRVILGEPGDDEALLGAVTLENFGLVLDPFNRELRPMRVRL